MEQTKVQKLKTSVRKKLDRALENRKPPHTRLLARMERLEEKLRQSVVISPFDKVTLSSGKKTSVYIHCKPILYTAEGQFLIGHIINQLLKGKSIQAVGGPAMGADPIALAVCSMSNFYRKQYNAFSIRKEAKDHGVDKAFCGSAFPGNNVVLVDDVLTTGNSLRDAAVLAEKQGLVIAQVIVLVDRQEGGKEAIENLGYCVQSLYTKRQLIRPHWYNI